MNDSPFDESIRPSRWEDYVGQGKMKSRLQTSIKAAITQRRSLDHIFLAAHPGTGKSTIARLIANEYCEDFKSITMPIKTEAFLDIVEDFEGVLLLDELHAASKAFQEMLQPALEDGVVRCPDGYEIDVSGIVFIGATTTELRSKVLAPLLQRFEICPSWEPYSLEEIALIIQGMATRLGFSIDADVAGGLAGACGETPRLAKRFVKAARDLGAVGEEVTVESVLDHVGVDRDGLGAEHMDYLRTVKAQGGKAGLRNLANLMGVSTAAVEDLERVLAVKGFVHLSTSGRRLTPAGKDKIATNAKAA
jgi:Holliday junction DNA helicase RuvB